MNQGLHILLGLEFSGVAKSQAEVTFYHFALSDEVLLLVTLRLKLSFTRTRHALSFFARWGSHRSTRERFRNSATGLVHGKPPVSLDQKLGRLRHSWKSQRKACRIRLDRSSEPDTQTKRRLAGRRLLRVRVQTLSNSLGLHGFAACEAMSFTVKSTKTSSRMIST